MKNNYLQTFFRPAVESWPLGIIIAIFLGAVFATTETRLISASIADLRGQFALDGLESSALLVTLNSAQLISMTLAPWAATVIGFNRTLFYPTILLGVVALLIPHFAHFYLALLFLHGLLGFSLGVYLPLTISLALRNAKPNIWLIIMAGYSLRVSIGMDSGMGISGFLVEEDYWQWIYWGSALAAPMIAFLFWKSIPLTPIDFSGLKKADWLGMILFTASLILIFIGFEGGERLGWLDSKVVVINIITGMILFALLVLRVRINENSFGSFITFSNRNILFCMVIACLFGFMMTPSSFLIPAFLEQMAGFKAIQSKNATLVVFMTYILSIPFMIYLARKIEARRMIAIGALMIIIAVFLGTNIHYEWRIIEFMSILVLQALGESILLLGLIAAFVTNLNPAHGVALGAYIPLARICAPIFSATIMLFWQRQQKESALFNLVESSLFFTDQESSITLWNILQREATVHAYIDSFYLVLFVSIIVFLLALSLRSAPLNMIAPPYNKKEQ